MLRCFVSCLCLVHVLPQINVEVPYLGLISESEKGNSCPTFTYLSTQQGQHKLTDPYFGTNKATLAHVDAIFWWVTFFVYGDYYDLAKAMPISRVLQCS